MAERRVRHRALATAPLRGPGLDKLRDMFDVVHEPWIDQSPLRIYNAEDLARRVDVEGATVLVVESDLVSGPVFERPLLAVAATRGEPTNVDLAAATAAGIPILYTPGRNADAVAELTVGLLLAVTRGIASADHDARSGLVWRDGTIPYQRFRGWELAGRSVGLIGLGAVGRATRWRLEALGMTVRAFDPYVAEADRDLCALLSSVDVVSVHAPVTEATRGMIGSAQFAAMRPGTVFLNTARASIHDPDALVEALTSGHLGGAGLDHVEGEALPDGHPLLALSHVVLTPHIGGATWDTEARGASLVADDLERLLRGGTPIHVANPEVLP
ncbi:MAG: 3-phosphoglycerate dehydrogenase [Actinomycetota bacterium]|nr:3-phosphoglycerate dehydrogenase [Actinomycetota bacterium]